MHLLYFKNIHDFIMILIITLNKIVLSNSLNHNNKITNIKNSDELPKSFLNYYNNHSHLYNIQNYQHGHAQHQQHSRQIHHQNNHLRHHHNKHAHLHRNSKNEQINLLKTNSENIKDSTRNILSPNLNKYNNKSIYIVNETTNQTIQEESQPYVRRLHQQNYQFSNKNQHSKELFSYSHSLDLNKQNYPKNDDFKHINNRYNSKIHHSHINQELKPQLSSSDDHAIKKKFKTHGVMHNKFLKTTESTLPARDTILNDNNKSKINNYVKNPDIDNDYSYYNYNDDDDDDDDIENEGVDNFNRLNEHLKSIENIKSETHVKKSNDLESDYQVDYLEDEPINQTSSNERFGSLTEEKWRNLGTAEAVERTRRRNAFEAQIVSSHITRIRQEAQCKYPRPKVIPIIDASKRYVPHCTILYRCGDDTGCCLTETKTCVAKQSKSVDLYFYAIPLGQKEAIVETVSFINHTECHCVERYRPSLFSQKLTRSIGDGIADNFNKKYDIDSNSTVNTNNCKCVTHFDVFYGNVIDDFRNYEPTTQRTTEHYGTDREPTTNELISKQCRCDCSSNNQVCRRLKEGQEGFPLYDQRCISMGDCTTPICQYGVYAKETGRCPRAKQKRTISRRQFKFD